MLPLINLRSYSNVTFADLDRCALLLAFGAVARSAFLRVMSRHVGQPLVGDITSYGIISMSFGQRHHDLFVVAVVD